MKLLAPFNSQVEALMSFYVYITLSVSTFLFFIKTDYDKQ